MIRLLPLLLLLLCSCATQREVVEWEYKGQRKVEVVESPGFWDGTKAIWYYITK